VLVGERLRESRIAPAPVSEIIRYARADVESARVDANREFFDNFDDIVESDAVWAYKFQRDYNKKIKDPDDIYLEIKDSEERRKKKGLPPRNKGQKTPSRKSDRSKPSARVTDPPQAKATPTAERRANNDET
jgi:hypothetical protein